MYVALIHIILVVSVVKAYRGSNDAQPKKGNEHLQRMSRYHGWIDANVPDQSAIFIGDSLTQGLSTAAVAERSTNFGIGGQTSRELLESIPSYASLSRADAIYIQIGINDILEKETIGLNGRLAEISNRIPFNVRLIWTSIMPASLDSASNGEIVLANEQIKAICEQRKNCTYIDSWKFMVDADGSVIKSYFLDDRIHLSESGYRKWIETLKSTRGRR